MGLVPLLLDFSWSWAHGNMDWVIGQGDLSPIGAWGGSGGAEEWLTLLGA